MAPDYDMDPFLFPLPSPTTMSDETSPVDGARDPDATGGSAEAAGPDTRPDDPDAGTSRVDDAADGNPTAAGAGSNPGRRTGPTASSAGLALPDANLLRSGTRLKVLRRGMVRQDLEGESAEGRYVSQFDSPVHGRLVVVHLPGRGNYGFRLDELERVEV